MPSLQTVCCIHQSRVKRALTLALGWLVLMLVLAPTIGGAHAEEVELKGFELRRESDGVALDFAIRFELPRSVDEALHKGLALNFVADAELLRSRWYWRDARVATATRTWRLTWQPLARTYRVNFGALSQSYGELSEALSAVQRSAHWRIADPIAADDGGRYYLIFNYRLDTALLPRPMQIGIGGAADWQLSVSHRADLPEAAK